MARYVLMRVLGAVPVLVGMSIITFILLSVIPGDPAIARLGPDATLDQIQRLREELGLNDPLYVRYLRWAYNVLQGDLGASTYTNTPVTEELWARLPTTFMLCVMSLAFSVLIGIPAGVFSAYKQDTWVDHVARVGSLLILSIPSMWLGILLILLFSVKLGWVPVVNLGTGANSDFWGTVKVLILPSIALGGYFAALVARITRSTMLEVLGQDFIRTARGKGLAEIPILFRHALKNAMIPVITIIGMNAGILLGGSAVIETVFVLPGIGQFLVFSTFNRDFPVITALVLYMGSAYVILNTVVDVLYGFLDPRVRA